MRSPPPLKYPGGQFYAAPWLVSLFPPRGSYTTYCEPYCGGCAVLLAHDPEGVSEVINDSDDRVSNFWWVLRDPDRFPLFLRMCEATPFAEKVFQEALHYQGGDLVKRAWAFFVVCRLSLAGRQKGFTSVTKSRTRRGMNNEVSAWLSAVEGLPAVHARLRRVLVLGPRDALDVVDEFDRPDAIFYLDPPWDHEARVARDLYRHEADAAHHARLLERLARCRARFVLSGYPSPLYDAFASEHRWVRHERPFALACAHGPTKNRRVHCAWTNYHAPEATP